VAWVGGRRAVPLHGLPPARERRDEDCRWAKQLGAAFGSKLYCWLKSAPVKASHES